MRLYEISEAIRFITDTDAELTDEQIASVDALGLALETKVDNIAALIREDEARSVAYQAELDRLNAAKRTADNRADRLKVYLKSCLEAAGVPKVETPRFRVRIQTNSQSSVIVNDVTRLPDWAKVVQAHISANREALLKAAEAGKSLPDGVKVERGTHLRIA